MKSKKRLVLFVLCLTLCLFNFFSLSNNFVYADTSIKKEIHFIDVGQGDAILIKDGQKSVLVDSGPENASDTLINYLKNEGITKIDYLVATHPDSDHIGGMDNVIYNFDVVNVISNNILDDSTSCKNFSDAMKDKNLSITIPQHEAIFYINDTSIKMVSGDKKTEGNDSSIVLKLSCMDKNILLCGDAKDLVLKSIPNLENIDLIKISHHGSSDGTSSELLKKIGAKAAIISVGANNNYGHPTNATLDSLKENLVSIYRTDYNGNIVAKIDNSSIEYSVDKNDLRTNYIYMIKTLNLYEGYINKLEVLYPENTKEEEVTYKSSNKDIATVDINGEVKAVKEGSCIISATTKLGLSAQCNINVKKKTLTYPRSKIDIYSGSSYKGKVSMSPVSKVTYTTSNSKIAKAYSSGEIKGLKVGKTYLYIKGNGITRKVLVNVKNKKVIFVKKKSKMIVGNKFKLKAQAYPTSKIKYKSLNKKIASVSSSGVIKAKKAGVVTIKAYAGGKSTKYKLKVLSKGHKSVYITSSGTCYHYKKGCSNAKKKTTLSKAKSKGLKKCSRCCK